MASSWKPPADVYQAGASSGRQYESQAATRSNLYGAGWFIKPSTDPSFSRAGLPQSYSSGDTDSKISPYSANPFTNSSPYVSKMSAQVSSAIDKTSTSLRGSQPVWEPHVPFRLKPFTTSIDVNKMADEFEKEQQQKREVQRLDSLQVRLQQQQRDEDVAQQKRHIQQQRKMLDDMLEKIESCDTKLNTAFTTDSVTGDKNLSYYKAVDPNSLIQRSTLPATAFDTSSSLNAQTASTVNDSASLNTSEYLQRPLIMNHNNSRGSELKPADGDKSTDARDTADSAREIYADVLAQTRAFSAPFSRPEAMECSSNNTQSNTRNLTPAIPASLPQFTTLSNIQTSNLASVNNAILLNTENCAASGNLHSDFKADNPFCKSPPFNSQHSDATVRQFVPAGRQEGITASSVATNNTKSFNPPTSTFSFEKSSSDQKSFNPPLSSQTQLRSEIARQRLSTLSNGNGCGNPTNVTSFSGQCSTNSVINSQLGNNVNATYPEKRSGDSEMQVIKNIVSKLPETDYRFRSSTNSIKSMQFNYSNGNVSSINEKLIKFSQIQNSILQNYCPKMDETWPVTKTSEFVGSRVVGELSRSINSRVPATTRLPEKLTPENNGASPFISTTDYNSLKRQSRGIDQSHIKPPLKLNGLDVKSSLPLYAAGYGPNSFSKRGSDVNSPNNTSSNGAPSRGTNLGYTNRQDGSPSNQFETHMSTDANKLNNSSGTSHTGATQSMPPSAGEIWTSGSAINRNSSASTSYESKSHWWERGGVVAMTSNIPVNRASLPGVVKGSTSGTSDTKCLIQPLQDRVNLNPQPQRSILKKNSCKNVHTPGTITQNVSYSTGRRLYSGNAINPYCPSYRPPSRDLSSSKADGRLNRAELAASIRFNQHDSRNQQKRVRFKF